MGVDDPLDTHRRLAALMTEQARLWRLRDANGRAARRNDERLVADLWAVQADIDDLQAAMQAQASADRALDRAAKGRAA